ncbi:MULTISPECIES: hypothetical protein [Clostridium]|uniref:Uncharacterized protein n=1 Tax=Clostridium frigoriphilum TaxID=443253 RepID=A0ABU7UUI2_9CLOT|nr:hypothetical protein [Clostridium sp. DSM 17811]MBU3102011.1 hypothetical protein [Clostridium sp. DSM 17811]
MNRYIFIDTNKKITGIRWGDTIVDGEIPSDLGETGQIQQTDGSFIDDTTPVIPPIPQPTNQEIMDNQEAIKKLTMSVMSGVFDLYMKSKEV